MKMANIGLATPERDSHTRQVSAAPTIASNEGKYRDRNPDMSTVSSAAAATMSIAKGVLGLDQNKSPLATIPSNCASPYSGV